MKELIGTVRDTQCMHVPRLVAVTGWYFLSSSPQLCFPCDRHLPLSWHLVIPSAFELLVLSAHSWPAATAVDGVLCPRVGGGGGHCTCADELHLSITTQLDTTGL